MGAGAERHVPVLLDRVLALLAPRARAARRGRRSTRPSASAATARRCCERIPALRLVGIDRDPEALRLAGDAARAVSASGSRCVHAVYDELPRVLADARRRPGRRGAVRPRACPRCSWTRPSAGSPTRRTRRWTCGWTVGRARPPADVVNSYPADELARVLRDYGEERFARRIAAGDRRGRARPSRSPRRRGWPSWSATRSRPPTRRTGGNPAKRTFQALRIEVNGELDALPSRAAGRDRRARRRRAGRRAVSYHSLEDRIVKRAFAGRARDTSPPGCRCRCPSAAPSCGC